MNTTGLLYGMIAQEMIARFKDNRSISNRAPHVNEASFNVKPRVLNKSDFELHPVKSADRIYY